ncbi:unnamed protein product [Prorocentrum cordatum]|uniref:Uncharacterized protein n=1 Tax=Prorocentrum cordatum TaxID=2364126 RepID=A0ABN9SQ34_9DINO|nr:unnamed protein product [Polarella glacialis]
MMQLEMKQKLAKGAATETTSLSDATAKENHWRLLRPAPVSLAGLRDLGRGRRRRRGEPLGKALKEADKDNHKASKDMLILAAKLGLAPEYQAQAAQFSFQVKLVFDRHSEHHKHIRDQNGTQALHQVLNHRFGIYWMQLSVYFKERDLKWGSESLSLPCSGLVDAAGGTSGAANLAPPAPRPSKGKGKGEDTEPRQQEAYTGAMASAASAAGAASEADGLGGGSHKSNKFNKIGTNEPGVGPQATKTSSTPRLDLLPPLRRAQFLQVVQRQVKSSGRHKEKQELAEEYLALCNGDYDEAYQYVKQLGENGAGLQ